jgi:putative ABC transport system permease protein
VLVYLFRSIKARWLENLAIIAVFTVVVTTGTLIISFAASMRQLAVTGGDDSTDVVVSRGATQLGGSSVGKPGYDWVRVRPELAQSAGAPLISPEMITQTQLRTSEGVSLFVAVRGVDPIAFQVHDKVHVIKGRLPAPDTDEIVIGKTLDGVFPGFSVGGHWNKHPIVGVFEAGGALLEHELWIDRQRLQVELGRRATDPIGFVFVKTKSPQDAKALVEQIAKSNEPLEAYTETTYLKTTGGDSNALMRLAIGFSVLLALGAGIASVNTLYSSLLGRLPEFAALYAIGVRRRKLAGLILQESVLLAIVGIVIGLGITVALNGQQISRLWTNHPFEQMPLSVGLTSIVSGVAIGLGVGIAGGLLPGLSIFRMDMRKYMG